MFKRPASTETALTILFDCGLHAHSPLSSADRLLNKDLPFPISFVFGDRDWMDSRGSREIIKNNKFFATGESQLHVLPGAGHQLFNDNPLGVAKLIWEDLTGRLSGTYQLCIYSIKYYDENGNETFLDDEEIDFRKKLRVQHELKSQELQYDEDGELTNPYVMAESILEKKG